MSDVTNAAESSSPSADEFPVARVEPRPSGVRSVLLGSRMWWVAIAAIALAGYLTWRSLGETGPTITLRFPEGHGLEMGDAIRHRGIDVGHVDKIALSGDLSEIVVTATLLPGAEGIARQGSEFWIVRPQIGLTQVTGIETALGPKYIAVRPAKGATSDGGKEQLEFEGLPSPPVGSLDTLGMEIVLRGDQSHGILVGSPVTWRGVEVGQVLAVDLASDTRFVDVQVRIDHRYRTLVRGNSKFWVIKGVGVDAGLLGIKVRTGSLTTIARGGIEFITPTEGEAAHIVSAGHVFPLHAEPKEEWTKSASTVSLIDFPLPPTVVVRAEWKEKQLGFTRNKDRTLPGLIVRAEEGATLIAPADVLRQPEGAIAGSWRVHVSAPGSAKELASLSSEVARTEFAAGVASCHLPIEVPAKHAVPADRLRTAGVPEDCCLVRTVTSDSGPTSVIQSISRLHLGVNDDGWPVEWPDHKLTEWHGSTVVAMGDGGVIGMLVVGQGGAVVVGVR